MRRKLPMIFVLPLLASGCAAGPDSPPTEAAESVPAIESTCTDSTDSGQMSEATASATADGLRLTWATTGTESAVDTVQWSATVQTADFSSAYQVGVKLVGAEEFYFVFDLNGAEQEKLDGAEVSADGASVLVPWDSLPGLESADFEWRAALSIDGADVAVCPQPGDDLLAPNSLTVERS